MKRWVWLTVSIVAIAIGVVTISVGLDNADKLASVTGLVVAVIGLGLGLAGPEKPMMIRVARSGKIGANGPAHANTGVESPARGVPHRIEVEDSGNVDSTGDGDANTGVIIR